jgi:hypothetical protein
METLNRTKQLLRHRSTFLSVAIVFSLLPFSFAFTGRTVYWAWRDMPGVASVAAAIGLLAWSAYAWTWYRVRTSGL